MEIIHILCTDDLITMTIDQYTIATEGLVIDSSVILVKKDEYEIDVPDYIFKEIKQRQKYLYNGALCWKIITFDGNLQIKTYLIYKDAIKQKEELEKEGYEVYITFGYK